MNVKIKKAVKKDNNIITNLLQLYLSNISLYFPMDMDQNTGLYLYDDINKYLGNSRDSIAFIITCDNRLAGFSFVDFSDGKNIIQEMFILNEYKRKGIGSIAVKKIFDKYKGTWVIKSLPCSKNAELFWKKVAKDYTNNNYEIEHIGKYNRAVITFNNEK